LVKFTQIDQKPKSLNINEKYDLKENFLKTVTEKRFKVYRRYFRNQFTNLNLYYTIMRPKR